MNNGAGGHPKDELDLPLRERADHPGPSPLPQFLPRRKRGQGVMLYIGRELRNDDIRALTPQERWARIALKLLVADCPYRPVLCISPGVPFTDAQISMHLMVSKKVWKDLKKKLADRREIEVDSKVGIKYPMWSGDYGFKWGPRFIPADPSAIITLSEEELMVHEKTRRRLIDTFNTITGHSFSAEEPYFIDCVEKRIAEGATYEHLDMGLRSYLWATLNATPKVSRMARPHKAFMATSFWKWVARAKPAPLGYLQSTFDFIRRLPDDQRKRGFEYCRDYTRETALQFRIRGWDSLYDVDFDRITTCKQYVKRMLEK